ncbi:MAG: hypothetical protein M0P14_00820 [Alkaliphilus sp.]|nr:hypothetical protein [Alkaliphilus sp.]
MSIRKDIMERVEDFVFMNNLCNVYSGNGISKDKKYRYVLFNKPRTLDGEIRIYGSNFICIKFQTGYRDLPKNGWVKFNSIDKALDFMDAAFVKFNMDKALELYKK